MTNEHDNEWKGLYKIGGAATIAMLVYSLVTMVLLLTVGGQPQSAQESFDMLAANRLVGLLRLDVLSVLVMPLYFLIFLGIWSVLKKSHTAAALVATLLGCAGVTLFVATPSVFSWWTLADKFAVATDQAQKNLLLAAGEMLLVTDMWHGTGAIVGGFLLQSGTFLVSVLMLQTKAFARITAWVGVVTHGLDLLHILLGFVFPMAGVALMMIAGPLYLLWFPLLARDFFRLAKARE